MAEIKNEFNVKPETPLQGGKVKYFAIFFLLLFVAGCSNTENKSEKPAIAVSRYFEAWNEKDYTTMYNLMSDGFKSLELTAATFDKFKAYAESQGIDKIETISIAETSNDGKQATVDYNIKFIIKGKEMPFKGTYTLKYKKEDIVPGWKLIHPYGDNIDTT